MYQFEATTTTATANPTLRQVFERYCEVKHLKPETARGYTGVVNRFLKDWLDLPISNISSEMIEQRHKSVSQRLSDGSFAGSPSQADLLMRVLRAVMKFSTGRLFNVRYPDAFGNPCVVIPTQVMTDEKLWNPKFTKKTQFIPIEKLALWWAAVQNRSNPARDILVFMLFTGFRLNECQRLMWKNVDLDRRIIHLRARSREFIGDTKNGHPLLMPISPYLQYLLVQRKRIADLNGAEYIFWSSIDSLAPVSTVHKSITAVEFETGIQFSCHDLRRTFINLCTHPLVIKNEHGISMFGELELRALLNHIDGITSESYLTVNPELLRPIVERVSFVILKEAGFQQ